MLGACRIKSETKATVVRYCNRYGESMKIMTEAYCKRCPFYDNRLGYLEDSNPYWQSNPSACVCATCSHRIECEQNGPKPLSECIKEEILARHPNLNPETIKRILVALGTSHDKAKQ